MWFSKLQTSLNQTPDKDAVTALDRNVWYLFTEYLFKIIEWIIIVASIEAAQKKTNVSDLTFVILILKVLVALAVAGSTASFLFRNTREFMSKNIYLYLTVALALTIQSVGGVYLFYIVSSLIEKLIDGI